MGIAVYCIDPSPVTEKYTSKPGIPLHVRFYAVKHPFTSVDMIVSTGVIEHVTTPVSFPKACHADLTSQGYLALSTPDAEPNIQLGDPAMVWHEHLSYFDRESLRATVEEAGYSVLSMEKAAYRASLFRFAQQATSARPEAPYSGSAEAEKFFVFKERMRSSIEACENYTEPLLKNSAKSVGFYVPLRALPYLSLIKQHENVRFFDDDPALYGPFFEGFPVAIEDFSDLQRSPCSDVIIMSLPHGRTILNRIHRNFGSSIRPVTLEQVLLGEDPDNE